MFGSFKYLYWNGFFYFFIPVDLLTIIFLLAGIQKQSIYNIV